MPTQIFCAVLLSLRLLVFLSFVVILLSLLKHSSGDLCRVKIIVDRIHHVIEIPLELGVWRLIWAGYYFLICTGLLQVIRYHDGRLISDSSGNDYTSRGARSMVLNTIIEDTRETTWTSEMKTLGVVTRRPMVATSKSP